MAKNYNEDNVRELKLYTDNDGQLYKSKTVPIYKNLQKKVDKGIYNKEGGNKAFLSLTNKSAKKYNKDYGNQGSKIFSVADRKQVAKEMREDFDSEIESGNRWEL